MRPLEEEWIGGDRSVWILFSPRPLSAALCKGWFRAVLLGLAAVSLLHGYNIVGELLGRDNPAIAGRFFRFTPLNRGHVFVDLFPHDAAAICRTRLRGRAQPSFSPLRQLGGLNSLDLSDVSSRCTTSGQSNHSTCAEELHGDRAMLVGERALLLFGGQELPMGRGAVSVTGQSLVVSLAERAVADGLMCDALRFPAHTSVTLKVFAARARRLYSCAVKPMLSLNMVAMKCNP